MKLSELDLMEFLPAWMRTDENAKALAYAIQQQLDKLVSQFKNLIIYASIDTQSDAILDELGWQFNIPEYSSSLPIGTKDVYKRQPLRLTPPTTWPSSPRRRASPMRT